MSGIIQKTIKENESMLWELSQDLWKNPELAYEETRAHNLLTAVLENFGFDVQRHYVLPTAFRAEFSQKNACGPTIAFVCEYDALPKIGHACGHNLIAEIGVAAGIAVKAVLENYPEVCGKQIVDQDLRRLRVFRDRTNPFDAHDTRFIEIFRLSKPAAWTVIEALRHDLSSDCQRKCTLTPEQKIVVLGTPAEEGGGGKINLIEKGAFKNIDAALMAHPQMHNRLYPLILALARITVKYKIKNQVDPYENLNAVDAAVACYNNVTLLRHSLKSKWRVSVIIRRSSGEESELRFSYRAPTQSELTIIRCKLKSCIEAAAKATDCHCESDFYDRSNDPGYMGMVTNETLAKTFRKYAESKGITFVHDDPRICESAVSSDMGNVSLVVPSIHPEFNIGAAAPHVNHTPGFATAAGSPKAQEPTLRVAEALAETALGLMTDRRFLDEVKAEFRRDPNIVGTETVRAVGE
ncbi:hypothetical protein JTE90_011189 [Oedothorax gibbosus]|uniref:Peptidase M20 domain-containing protein 2 n=1 Tax=Oedothorax gibbosus TaxID=931172 RepID=A0AAV6VY03_9ARAC|nr:hypothetical protein JTE90_011189 [Oedothorax gibbosus]